MIVLRLYLVFGLLTTLAATFLILTVRDERERDFWRDLGRAAWLWPALLVLAVWQRLRRH